jgi:hypothetical protein
LAVTVALVAVGVYQAWPKPVPPGVNRESFEKIRPGMSLAEVEAILGGPPTKENFEGARDNLRLAKEGLWKRALLPAMVEWRDGDILIVLWFDPETEKVVQGPNAILGESSSLSKTFIEALKRFLREWYS